MAVVSSLGLMIVLATIFQLTLPRLRSEWIATALDEHTLVMQGTAGTPWQYRILSDYLMEVVMRVMMAAGNHDRYVSAVYAFVVFRGAQLVCIFGLGFVYFRKLGLGAIASVIGLGIVCAAMVVGQIETNWQLDAYTDVVLYLLAAIFALSSRFELIIPVAVLGALNRETGVFIPLMPLAFV
ncbi:MAG: hypothetical protein M3044_06225, partial [Thermoproteota archaeon]|nr:hypothetical protein [Thermoproteota archaeon]